MSTPRPTVWVSQPVFPDQLAPLYAHCDVRVAAQVCPRTPEEMRAALRDVDGALVSVVDRVDAAAIAGAARLRAVANIGVGHDNLDLPALTAAGVLATNTPDVLTETTADHAFALLLAAARRVGEAERWLRAGHWRTWSFDLMLGRDVHGSTLGVLGMGRIGRAIARRAAGFGMRVLYHNRTRLAPEVEQAHAATWVTKAALLAECDHLMVVLPHSAATQHAVGAAELAALKPTATIVNISRGGVVDDAALAAALCGKRLAAAGLDVFENEPALHPDLLACDNAVLTPHIGSASEATRRGMVRVAVSNLVAALGFGPDAGRPPHLLNPAARSCRVSPPNARFSA